MSNISLATATGTRLDSAAKHIVVSRVSTDFYAQHTGNTAELLNNELEYRINRDELCLGVGRALNPTMGFSHADHKAYPSVFSNAGLLQKGNGASTKNESTVAEYYTQLYDARTAQEAKVIKRQAAKLNGSIYFPCEFYFAGIALTQAFAHPHSGDTALSCMVGGLKTIRNGRFEVYPGDKIMWYFEFEADAKCFTVTGERVPRGDAETFDYASNIDLLQDASQVDVRELRKRDHELAEVALTKKLVYPKPYLPGFDGKGVSAMDKTRVFGKALRYAGPYDHVDIMMCRQSM